MSETAAQAISSVGTITTTVGSTTNTAILMNLMNNAPTAISAIPNGFGNAIMASLIQGETSGNVTKAYAISPPATDSS